MSARDRIRLWIRRLLRRRERTEIDYEARRQFEERERHIASLLLDLEADVMSGRHRPHADRMHR